MASASAVEKRAAWVGIFVFLAGLIGGSLGSRPMTFLRVVSEIRFGVLSQNLEGSGWEQGYALNFEVLLGRLEGLDTIIKRVARPRIHLGATISLQGYTSRGYAGLTWEVPLPGEMLIEVSGGGAIHDGALTDISKAAYGCRLNFREAVTLGADFPPRIRLMGMVEHMSNAGLCSHNRGLTSGGLRVGIRLD